jgi:hypothetical protein
MPIFREIEEGRVGKRPFLQPLTWFGRYAIADNCVLYYFYSEYTKKFNKITYKIDKNANIFVIYFITEHTVASYETVISHENF